jgi:hypothetical protein
MREDEYPLTLGDAMGYFKDGELNSHNELFRDFKLLLKAHREYLNGLSNSEYKEYKRRRYKASGLMSTSCYLKAGYMTEGEKPFY